MPRPNGPQFRKVGDHKLYRHRVGNWETVDNYHFQQGTPPTNLWDVHDLRDPNSTRDGVSGYPLFESQHSDLKGAHAEFRQSYPERDAGENPLLYS